MPKVKYVGPGRENDQRVIEVQDHEVAALTKNGHWKQVTESKATKSAKSEGADNG